MSFTDAEISYLLSEPSVERARTAWRQFNLELGIPGIDKQHLWLLAILLELETLLEGHTAQPSILTDTQFHRTFARILSEAVDYSVEHFQIEEALLQAQHYPAFSAHKRQHTRFIAGLRLRMREIQNPDPDILRKNAERLLASLKQWLFRHILSEDRKYVEHFSGDSKLAWQKECEASLHDLGMRLRYEQERLYELVRSVPADAAGEGTSTEGDGKHAIAGLTPELLRAIAGIWHTYRLQIGVPIIDMQHLWLIKLVVELEQLDRKRLAGPVPTQELSEKFNEAVIGAIDYVNEHFSTEESLMRKFNFPGFASHIKQHKNFVAFINDRNAEHRAGNSKALNHLVQDLKEWLISHIAIEDKRIYFFLHKRMKDVNEYVRELAKENRLVIRPGYLELYNMVIRFQAPASGT